MGKLGAVFKGQATGNGRREQDIHANPREDVGGVGGEGLKGMDEGQICQTGDKPEPTHTPVHTYTHSISGDVRFRDFLEANFTHKNLFPLVTYLHLA